MEDTVNDNCCLFCYRTFKPMKLDEIRQEQFLRLLKRYLINDKESDFGNWVNRLLTVITSSSESVRNVLEPCTDCSGIIKSFCEYYEEIQILQIKLEWRLQTLKDIVRSSETVKLRRTLFQVKLEEAVKTDCGSWDVKDFMKCVKSFRKKFIEKGAGKLKESYPKLKLMRCDCSGENSTEPGLKRRHEDEDDDPTEDRSSAKFARLEKLEVSSSAEDKVNLLAELLNEPDLKLEPSEPRMLMQGEDENETVEEIQLDSESDSDSVEGSMVTQTQDHHDDDHEDVETAAEKFEIGDPRPHEHQRNDINIGEILTQNLSKSSAGSHLPTGSLKLLEADNVDTAMASSKTEGFSNFTFDQLISKTISASLGKTNKMQARNDNYATFKFPNLFRRDSDLEQDASSSVNIENDNLNTCIQPTENLLEGEDQNEYEHEEIKLKSARNSKSPQIANMKLSEAIETCSEETGTTAARRLSLRQRYECTICSKTFISNEALMKHIVICLNAEKDRMESESEDDDAESNHSNSLADFSPVEEEMEFQNEHGESISEDVEVEDDKHELSKTKILLKLKSNPSATQHSRKVKEEACDNGHQNLDKGESENDDARPEAEDGPQMLKLEESLSLPEDSANEEFTMDISSKNSEKCSDKRSPSRKKRKKTKQVKIPSKSVHSKNKVKPNVTLKHNKNAFVCEDKECNEKFGRKRELTMHVKKVHEDKKISCSICKKGPFNRDGLIVHQNYVHLKFQLNTETTDSNFNAHSRYVPDELFKCPVSPCAETFKNKQNLEAHSLLHDSFKCHFCEETKSYAPDLAIHEATSHKPSTETKGRHYKTDVPTFSCSRCNFPEYKETLYVQHFLRAHLDLTMVVSNGCCICKTVIPKYHANQGLLLHFKSHHCLSESLSTLYRCDSNDCQAYFLKEDQLKFHKLLFHNEKRKFTCEICKKTFASRFLLRKHARRMHKLEYHIPCPHSGCKNRFPDEESLEKHVSFRHSKVASIQCPQCKQTFKDENNLKNHIKAVHAPNKVRKPPVGKMTYVCPECGKSLKDKGALDIHVLGVHRDSKEWKFSCDICNKKCLTQRKLEEHRRVHTKEKPFTCDKCGLSYAHRHNFRHHLKNKHGVTYAEDSRRKKI